MKGYPYQEYKHKLVYPCYAEAKVDEIRCHVWYDNLKSQMNFDSYAGKPLHNMRFAAPLFEDLMEAFDLFELDCGVLVNGNFNDSYRWVRSSRGAPADLDERMVRFTLYDAPEDGHGYAYRLNKLNDIMAYPSGITWERVPRLLVNTPTQAEQFFEDMQSAGYEGAMLKNAQHLYVRKRSWDWLKMKSELDGDGKIIDMREAVSEVGEPLGRIGSVHVLLEDGSSAWPAGIAHELGRQMMKNPDAFLGEWCEFVYMERDRQGGYRHPRFKRIREAKA